MSEPDKVKKAMPEIGALPHWDLTTVFPSLDSPELRERVEWVRKEVEALEELFDARGVRRRTEPTVDDNLVAAYAEVTGRINTLLREVRVVRSYAGCEVATDAENEAAQALLSELRILFVRLSLLDTRYVAWVGTSDVDALLASSQVARDHEFHLRRSAVEARHQMPEAEEGLAAELTPTGLAGWMRLHGDVSALLTAPVTVRGEEKSLPMSAIRALANDPDREVRRAAYEAELKGWESVCVPMAAALNGVKGYQGVIRKRRGWEDDVAPTLIDNSIDAATLTAMQQACVESFPDFRRYLRAKARALGLDRLAWYDVTAPMGEGASFYTWPEAEAFIRQQFATFSPRMFELADRSFRERWNDAEPRAGKEGGAFCTGIRPGESRILMNYDGSFNSVSTLAHELGHAYHNLCLGERTPLQKDTPSTLAETASIFCETIAFEAALRGASEQDRLALVETSLQRDLLVVVDIHSRFLFEKAVFERRPARELSAREFNELMLDAQEQTYGDALDPELRHPYMWAVKGHYYGPTFYNYPYTFGLLFGLGLYARYLQSPEGFPAGYDDLLSSTGMADAATLGQRFGLDTRSVDFWRSSLDVIREHIADFEKLL